MKLHLVTFGNRSTRAGRDFFANASALRDAALAGGVDHAHALSSDVYAGTSFEARNAELLREPRGAGYWVWKPWVIRRALDQIGPEDVLLYSDAGKRKITVPFPRPDRLAQLARLVPEGMIAGMQLYNAPNGDWTKGDAFSLMEGDEPEFHTAHQIQVGWSAWTQSPAAYALLDQWQRFNEDRRIVSDDENVLDLPNDPGFVEHRHDQSIYTLLVFKMNLPFLDFSRRPARRFVRQVRARDGVSLRKIWGGEAVLKALENHFAQQGESEPLKAVARSVVRRIRQ
ncbi:hypothetical protein SAMN05421688_2998 [Poseidonocella pacifica]|uniref:Capsular polysaccharide synthesis protein n=1 Tax=Poseidonocella pacifica TaxID=871651 RepID=A0A1I0YFQ2_9RHOB|nr:hypothetical protein [Poseidonocella pacifica]SFB11657.1 hypothetical protein SAMN05421688_2998 [Poseidonocella pacifica]